MSGGGELVKYTRLIAATPADRATLKAQINAIIDAATTKITVEAMVDALPQDMVTEAVQKVQQATRK
jgi:hypothetical protein